ncbi:MAG: DNA polymerase III subunit delta [Fibrobacteraceae bacterium]|jgi:DNA polymerase-3 subunit delta|nr:DNA polymerase III subunit delta [Fibrobacteraceae bacterium]
MISVITGEDFFSKNLAIEAFLKKALGESINDPMAYKTIYATDPQIPSVAEAIIEACDTVSMFSEEQTVILRQADELKESENKLLAEWLSRNPDCSLLMEFKSLKATSTIGKALKAIKLKAETFDLPKDYKLPEWIMENCKKHFNKNIDRNACAYIAEAIGNDTWKIMSELKNILFLNPNIPAFSENIVKSFIVPTRKMQAFEINKFFGDRNPEAYVKKLHELIEEQKIEPIVIVSQLFNYAVQLLHIATMLEQNMRGEDIAKALHVNEYIFLKLNNEPRKAMNWGKPLLCRLIKRLAELDYEFKSDKYPTKTTQELALAALVIPPR